MRSFARYVHVGVFSFFANLALTALFHEALDAPEPVAFALALGIVFFTNFALARRYIFAAQGGALGGQFARFLATALLFRLLEWLGFWALNAGLDTPYWLAAPATLGASSLSKYFFYRALVFPRPQPPTEPGRSRASGDWH